MPNSQRRNQPNHISSLPPELLSDIFELCTIVQPDAPLVLRKVSKVFYDVVQAAPRVWGRLDLRLHTHPAATSRDHDRHNLSLRHEEDFREESGKVCGGVRGSAAAAKARTWFDRSGACGVRVRLDITRPPRRKRRRWVGIEDEQLEHGESGRFGSESLNTQREWDRVVGILSRHSSRVRNLEVFADGPDDVSALLAEMYRGRAECRGMCEVRYGDRLGEGDGEGEVWDGSIQGSIPLMGNRRSTVQPSSPSSPVSSPSSMSPSTLGDGVYDADRYHAAHDVHALESLSIHLSSPTHPSSTAFEHVEPPTALLRHLSTLRLTNYTSVESLLGHADLSCLRSLSITLPIRAVPLDVDMLVGVLRTATGLVDVELEARMSLRGGGGGGGHGWSGLEMGLGRLGDLRDDGLVHLPYLKRLSLTTNLVCAMLGRMVVPNLEELRVEDWDGKRTGASEEIAEVMKEVMARSNSERETWGSLRLLELVGVDVQCGGTWGWSFSRLETLEELRLGTITDATGALDILNSPCDSTCAVSLDQTLVCPRLSKVYICPMSREALSPGLARRLRALRRGVELVVEVVNDPFYQSSTTGPVDFLRMYTDGAHKVARSRTRIAHLAASSL